MVKRVCTYNSQICRNSRRRAVRYGLYVLILFAASSLLAGGNLRAQPSEAPPAAPAEEARPEVQPPAASEAAPPPAETAPETKEPAPPPAEPEKPATEPESNPAAPPKVTDSPPEQAKADQNLPADKPRVEQPAVGWSDEIAATIRKKTPEGVQDLRTLQKQVQQVVRHALPATLGVQLGDAAGSAVIVSADGLVLTAGHVAGVPGREVNCYFSDGRRAKGITLGLNRSIDSGMIRLTEPGPWPFVKLSEETNLKPGEWVVALGHAGGFDPRRTPPARIGRVLYQNDEIIHTDCALVGGDSGGPLFNLHGELVGIHSRIGRRITSNFHVPVGTYRETWDRLVAGEAWGGRLDASEPVRYRPSLGLAVQSENGVCRVTQVFANGPSKIAGVEVGDIILQFAEQPVKSADELTQLLWKQKPNDKVKIEIEREGKPQTIELRLGQIAQSFPGSPEPPAEDEEQEG